MNPIDSLINSLKKIIKFILPKTVYVKVIPKNRYSKNGELISNLDISNNTEITIQEGEIVLAKITYSWFTNKDKVVPKNIQDSR